MAQLMPMHMLLDGEGRIQRIGPTLQKIVGQQDLTGLFLTEAFSIRRPRKAISVRKLIEKPCARLQIAPQCHPETLLKGQVLPRDDGEGAIINTSFGISVVDAVARFGLTIGDFAVTDLAVELLYLVESNAAVTEELRKLNRRLHGAKLTAEEQAFADTLTGLRNRRAMDQILARLIAEGRPFALMHMDLDYFKQVNDQLGHAAGDHVLRQVAGILIGAIRSTDTAVRFGGDEFVLIFEGMSDRPRLTEMAENLIERIERPIAYGDDSCKISASIGLALSIDYREPEAEQILHDADMALYASKNKGKACVSWSDPPLSVAS